VFSAKGSYATPQAYVDGLIPALWVGAAVVAVAAVAALALPGRIRVPLGSGVAAPASRVEADATA
jgi:hypothetical protein